MPSHLALIICAFVLAPVLLPAGEPAPASPRKQLLDQLRRILPKSEPWEAWLEKTGELPPDFSAVPSTPSLPDPLRFLSGKEVKKEDWSRRRQELLGLFQQYVVGTWPVSPGNVRLAQSKPREEPGAHIEQVALEFGPDHQARLNLELLIPKGAGPFPVFLTPDTHRSWALIAVSRGYVGCVFAAADSRDDTAKWKTIWPDLDWGTLARRAWAASRCVDYLQTLPFIDKDKIALAGHSRNGKAALIAAAFDQRINAVISSSSGAGGACPWRMFSEAEFGEGIELITRTFPDWFHPRLRFFAGRENKLPIDQSELIACIAPRSCLISSALNDNVESIWAIEQSYASARRVYELLGRNHELNLLYRPGGHETRADNIETYLDWLDTVFRRSNFAFADSIIYPTYSQWQQISQERVELKEFPTNDLFSGLLRGANDLAIITPQEWLQKKEQLRGRILWGLGEAPAFVEAGPGKYGVEAVHRATLLGRATVPAGLQKQSFNFGNYIPGDLYFPTNRGAARLPAVIWLHPISVSHGYMPGYRRGDPPHIALARLGFAVFAFDQIGHGTRLEEVHNFYPRYPHWSLLGKQVEDTLAAVEAVIQLDIIDSTQIYLLGYGTGGMVALHAAALDERVAGVVSVAGFTPMRLDTLEKGTGGVARWAGWMPLQPRLGAFVGHEMQIPYDYHEVLSMIAPRPALIFAPRIDYRATLADVRKAVEEATKVYGLFQAKSRLQLHELEDYNRFSPESQEEVYRRLQALVK